MVETNIRIVNPGMALSVAGRKLKVDGPSREPELLERACALLRARHGLAAVRLDPNCLFAAGEKAVPSVRLRDEDWEISVHDEGEADPLTLDSTNGVRLLPTLVERAVLARLAELKVRWVISGTPRHWYERRAFQEYQGVSAYRRAGVASLNVTGEGVGITVDFQTAFFTTQSLAWFFESGLSRNEAERRRQLFDRLAKREHGEGTLLYERGSTRTTCYFSEAPPELTCDSAGSPRVRGVSYESVYDYYQKTCPELGVTKSDRAVLVSFPSLKGSVPVAAKLLRLRVFNDSLPEKLQHISASSPKERRERLFSFWKELEPKPLGKLGASLRTGLWTPPTGRVWRITPPDLKFGNGKVLKSPQRPDEYRDYYFNRIKLLREAGCYQFPPATPRLLQCAYPTCVSDDLARDLLTDLQRAFKKWTGKDFSTHPIKYSGVEDGVAKVHSAQEDAMLLFVLNGDRNAYYTVSLELGKYRPKRVTEGTLAEHHLALKQGAWDRRAQANTMEKGKQKWESFVGLTGLDMLQLQDGVPWAIPPGPFEAVLVIDVSYDHRYFGLSLLVARMEGRQPSFRIITEIKPKVDSKEEAMNPEVLEEEAVKFIKQKWPATGVPLESMLVLRDGRLCKQEPTAIKRIQERLMEIGVLGKQARFSVVEFLKETEKQIRLWDVHPGGEVRNALEGTAVEISSDTVVLLNTGATTLPQGTAEPLVLHAMAGHQDARDAATVSFHTAQLNWSNPRVAQRLPLPLNRTDEELIARSQQEARHSR